LFKRGKNMEVMNITDMKELIEVARGDRYADLILRGGKIRSAYPHVLNKRSGKVIVLLAI
jgi:hypothetical protein